MKNRDKLSIIGTCGHEIEERNGDFGTAVMIKDWVKDGSPAVAFHCVCDKCLTWYEENDLILRTDKDCKKWMNSDESTGNKR